MSTKKVQSMTPKRFVAAKLSGKVTAEGFLDAHKAFLKGQEYLAPILAAYEAKELLPTPTVQACQAAVLSHILETESLKGESKVQANKDRSAVIRRKKSEGAEESEVTARYKVTLMCKFYSRDGKLSINVGEEEKITTIESEKDGVVVFQEVKEKVPAIFQADTYQAASRIADRKLCERGDSVYAVIVNTHDRPIETHIQRDDAIARLMVAPKGPSTRNVSSGGSNLGFGIKAKNDRSHFSRG